MITLNQDLLQINKETEILSAYIAGQSIAASLERNEQLIKDLAKTIHNYGTEELLLVGSGASYCTLYTGYYYLKTNSTISAIHNFGPVVEFDAEKSLEKKFKNKKVFAIVASYSGKTADTVSVSNYLQKHGVPRIALSKDENGPLARGCDYVLPYRDKCLYTSAMANLLKLISEFLLLRGETQSAKDLSEALKKLPKQMDSVIKSSEDYALKVYESVRNEDFFYVLGDGALSSLAYQYGYTNLIEYSRVHAACLRSCEWRHGPLEILFRKPAMIHFIGNDTTRPYSLATKKYCEENGAKVITFDSMDYFETLPALAPFAVHIVSQLFFMYQSTDRSINMDDYLQMHVKPYKPGETYY